MLQLPLVCFSYLCRNLCRCKSQYRYGSPLAKDMRVVSEHCRSFTVAYSNVWPGLFNFKSFTWMGELYYALLLEVEVNEGIKFIG